MPQKLTRREILRAGAVGLTALMAPAGWGRMARAQGGDARLVWNNIR